MLKKIFGIAFCLLVLAQPVDAGETAALQEENFAQALRREYREQGNDHDVELEFYGGQLTMKFPHQTTPKIMLTGVKFDELKSTFSADAEIFADGKSVDRTHLVGKFYVLGSVYVPAKNINKGEVLDEKSFKKIQVRMNRIKTQNVVELAQLIGKEAKRTLKVGKIVNKKDIGKVMVIKKGDLIRLIYQTRNMQIAAKVEAMQDGAKGDKIEVRNINSKKTLSAEVVDAGIVAVDVH